MAVRWIYLCGCCTHSSSSSASHGQRCWAILSFSVQHTIRPARPRRVQYLKRLQQGKQRCPDRCRRTYKFFDFHTTLYLSISHSQISLVAAVAEQFTSCEYTFFSTVYCIFQPIFYSSVVFLPCAITKTAVNRSNKNNKNKISK